MYIVMVNLMKDVTVPVFTPGMRRGLKEYQTKNSKSR